MAPNPEFASIAWAGPASSGRSRAGLGPYRYITWHCTSNPTSSAYAEASFARNRTDGVGTHATADAAACLQTQVTSLSVGHVGSSTGNRYGVAIECCGVESDSAEHWRPIIDRCVPFVRAVMAKYGIANRWLTIDQMRDGRSTGHITHDMARIAWGSTDHTDPGPFFPKQYVIDAVAGPAPVATPTGDDDMKYNLVRHQDDPQGAVFLTTFGGPSKWVQSEADLNDYLTLATEGRLDLVNTTVRVVGNRHLIEPIIGPVPTWWQLQQPTPPAPGQ